MFSFILKRSFQTIPTLFIIVTASFFLIRLAPGNPFDNERTISSQLREELYHHYGLEKSLSEQYLQYLKNLLQGDLGASFKNPGWGVGEIINQKLFVSLELGLYALIIAVIIGVLIGIIAAWKNNTWLDHFFLSTATIGVCIPTFVIGPLLVLLLSVHLNWFNASGWVLWQDRVLPALTLGIPYAAYLMRLTRGSMIEIKNQEYIRTAMAKGLSSQRVIFFHGLRNGILPVIAFLGPAVAGLITGSFVVETIFRIPGLGQYFVTAAFNRDYTMILGTVIFYAIVLIVLNLITDIIQIWLNPKQKFE